MNHFDQRGPCVAEKVVVQQTRRTTQPARRKIGSRLTNTPAPRPWRSVQRVCCGAVVGKSLHAPMT